MVTIGFCDICNNNCIMCSTRPFDKKKIAGFDKTVRYLDRFLKNKSPDSINFTGGEPTIIQDFIPTLDYVKKRFSDTQIRVLSNGRRFIYEHYVKKLVDLKIDNFSVEIPLHASNAELHDSITQTPGSFDQTLQGIKNLLKHKVSTAVRVVVHKMNYKNLPELAELILKDLGEVDKVIFIFVLLQGNAFKNKDKAMVRYDEMMPFLESAIEILKDKINIELYHFPLCTLKSQYRKYAISSLQKHKVMFIPICKKCKEKINCLGILKTHAFNVGIDEFKPI